MHDPNFTRHDNPSDPRMNERLQASPRSGKALGIGIAVVIVLAALALWMGGSGDTGQKAPPANGNATMSQPAQSSSAPATNAPATNAPAATAPAANAPTAPQSGNGAAGTSGN